jgi:transcriptional regulator with XRE-family HTH domain
MNILAYNLRQSRKNHGWSQEQVARMLGVSLYTVQRWELGKTHPSPLAVAKLEELFGKIAENDQFKLL